MRSRQQWLSLIAKGFAMGSADLVPGVSGGTIAFITGIYNELIETIAALGPRTIKDLFKIGVVETWRKYNLGFLVALVSGIALAVLVLSNTIHHFQVENPEELRSFFVGLVIASTPIIFRSISNKSFRNYTWCAIGIVLALVITSLPPSVQTNSPLFIALSGAIAISAMLLPGISGSFILLILGAYSPVIAALAGFDFVIIIAFLFGVIGGLLAFSRVLKKVLENHRDLTLSLLLGFMIGALHVLWPWRENVTELYTHSDGRIEWITAKVLPTGDFYEVAIVAIWAIVGAIVVTALDKLSNR
tara:strand:+ start:963 stop:1868 length:906 start_codon:yes stop_codon:yes gene_type:complete